MDTMVTKSEILRDLRDLRGLDHRTFVDQIIVRFVADRPL